MNTRAPGGLSRRLSRIDRWLKRCAAACRCGSWASALIEVECLEAETRGFREELWGLAAEEAEGRAGRPLRAVFFAGARALVLALIIVILIGFPLSVDQDAPFKGFGAGTGSVAVLTSTESDILDALRESLSNRNADRIVLAFDRAQDTAPESLPPGAAMAGARTAPRGGSAQVTGVQAKPETPDAAGAQVNTAASRENMREPSVEEVISLIQVGQRALRVSEPAVKIVP